MMELTEKKLDWQIDWQNGEHPVIWSQWMEVKEGALTKIRHTERGMQTLRVEHKLVSREGMKYLPIAQQFRWKGNYLNLITI